MHKVSENESLTKPFSLEEVDFAIKETKKKHSTRSHGFSVEFFKGILAGVRLLIKEMLDDLHKGTLDLRRLNYGVIILLRKMKLPNNMKQLGKLAR